MFFSSTVSLRCSAPLHPPNFMFFLSFKTDDKNPQNIKMKFKTNKQNTNKTKIANTK